LITIELIITTPLLFISYLMAIFSIAFTFHFLTQYYLCFILCGNMRQNKNQIQRGFTIVELLIVIVVIGILAAITIVAYNGIQQRARTTTLTADLRSAATQLKIDQANNNLYPATIAAANNGSGLKASPGTTYRYSVDNTSNPQTFCLSATEGTVFYSVTQASTPTEGSCVNVAAGASATSAILTDGNTASNPYYGASAGLVSVTVTMAAAQDVSSVKVWHYYADGRTYYATKTEVSEDGTNWSTVYDSAVSGTYQETAAGKTFSFPQRKVRYIRDWLNGSSSNTSNHWVEIQAY
jgi:prepilin-type N-terminal cleavage/methylation domain-containing protein